MSDWINFVREYASKKKVNYGEALKDPACRQAYHKKKGKTETLKVEKPRLKSALKEPPLTRPKGPVKSEKIKPKLITEQFEGKLFANQPID